MAEKLNVRLHDVIRLKFQTLYGQVQIARFTVVAVIKADNPFFNSIIYCHLKHLKPLMGYQEHETGGLRVILENVTDARQALDQATPLHNALQPGAAGYVETVQAGLSEETVTVLAVRPDEESRRVFVSHLQIVDGDPKSLFQDEEAVMLSRETAERLHVRIGDEVTSSHRNRFDEIAGPRSYRVGAIFMANDMVTKEMMFVHVEQ
jgi:ABC-type lipoprotein release transport system permease subunit